MAQPTLVAAVVVTYNSEEFIGTLLDSLPAAFGSIPYRTVVVDNGSSDATLEILDARTDCLVVRSENTGFAAGINTGARHVPEAEAILVLNPDATLSPGAVPAMAAVLAEPGVGVVAPRVSERDGSLSLSLRRGPTMLRAGGLSFTRLPLFEERVSDPREYTYEHDVDWAVGAVLLISRACFDALEGFDESYFLYSEETDFSLRAQDRGWRTVYTPAAHAMHVGGGSGESATTHTMKIVNRVRLFRRRHTRAATWLYFLLLVAIEVRRGLLGHRSSWTTVRALLSPGRRPVQLGAGAELLPGWQPRLVAAPAEGMAR